MGTIAYMTANDVARETGWAMRDWSSGDRATNEAFAPIDTYEQRLDDLLARVAGLGFDTVDVWGGHLNPEWATDEHVAAARRVLDRHGLTVSTYATWLGPNNVARSCELARALGTDVIGGGFSGDPEALAPALEEHGVTLAVENHPEQKPAEVIAKIERGGPQFATTVDTGWWGTHGYDPAQAIRELGSRVRYVHLKDVRAVGTPHVTCRWGEGVVDIEACVRALQEIGYGGGVSIEHEPETWDPTEDVRAMRAELVAWLA